MHKSVDHQEKNEKMNLFIKIKMTTFYRINVAIGQGQQRKKSYSNNLLMNERKKNTITILREA